MPNETHPPTGSIEPHRMGEAKNRHIEQERLANNPHATFACRVDAKFENEVVAAISRLYAAPSNETVGRHVFDGVVAVALVSDGDATRNMRLQ